MGWGFRKSFNLGPLRINASKSGLGYSIGGRGFRVGRDSRGRKYRAISIPGTGIFNRTYTSKKIGNQKPASYNSSTPPSCKQSSQSLSQGLGTRKVLLYIALAFLIYFVVGVLRHLL
jgi:hypothetical protein